MINALDAALDYAQHGWPVFPAGQRRRSYIRDTALEFDFGALNQAIALRAAAAGLPVFPANSDQTNPDFKRPLVRHGFRSATGHEHVIRGLWATYPAALPAINCEAAGLLIIDCDKKPGKPDGLSAWQALAARREGIASAPVVITPSGGIHVYFRLPKGMKPSNATGDLPAGIDVRGAGYVIAPGAVLASGQGWFVASDSLDPIEAFELGLIPILPNWLREILEAKKAREIECPRAASMPSSAPSADRERAYGRAALDRIADDLALVSCGRNEALNIAAFKAGRQAGAGRISEADVHDALLDACRRNGWLAKDGPRAFDATFKSGFGKGFDQPAEALAENTLAAEEPWLEFVDGKIVNTATGDVIERATGNSAETDKSKATEAAAPLINFSNFSVAGWLTRDIPPRDYLLGDALCTTSRWIIYGETGIGKTLFSLEMAAAVAAGEGMLSWEARRPGRVLYIDGEMPEETFRERMQIIAEKYGRDIPLTSLNRDALEREYPKAGHMPPLNARPGQEWLLNILSLLNPELIVFDSIMCLLGGNMLEEESWEPMKPLVRYLTGKRIAQIWLHHTGHDNSKAYGTKTREWEMDTVLSLTKPDGAEGILAEFTKARLRVPRTAAQFESRIIRRDDEGWTTDGCAIIKGSKRSIEIQRMQSAFVAAYERLADGVEKSPGLDGKPVLKVRVKSIRDELANRGFLDKDDKGQVTATARSRFGRVKSDLITEGLMIEDADAIWKIRSF